MSDNKNETDVEGVIKATTELVKAVPVYEDMVQPAAKEIGVALKTVAKTINVALAPVSAVVWSYETIKSFVDINVAERLKNTPPENIITPNPIVAGPTLDALRYTGHVDTLRDMYANLLANALDVETEKLAHPSFVELIKQLSPSEAKLLLFISEREEYPEVCTYVNQETVRGVWWQSGSREITSNAVKNTFIEVCTEFNENIDIGSALDNFRRLQILDIESSTSQAIKKDRLSGFSNSKVANDRDTGLELSIKNTQNIFFTKFGEKFIDACVKTKK